MLTTEDWTLCMYAIADHASAWSSLYFIAILALGTYILLNLFIAIMVEGFATDPEALRRFKAAILKTRVVMHNISHRSLHSAGAAAAESPAPGTSSPTCDHRTASASCERFAERRPRSSFDPGQPHGSDGVREYRCTAQVVPARPIPCITVQGLRSSAPSRTASSGTTPSADHGDERPLQTADGGRRSPALPEDALAQALVLSTSAPGPG